MAWSDFESCCSARGVRDIGVLEHAGEDAVKGAIHAWGQLPADVKAAMIAAVRALGTWAAAAIAGIAAAAAIEGGELIGWLLASVLVGIDVGVVMDELVECVPQW